MLMKRYADEVFICYDADEAGQKAAQRAIGLLRNAGMLIRVISIPGAKDPDEFIRENGDKGPAKFKQLLQNSGNDVEYRLQKLKGMFDLQQTEGKVAYLTEASKVLASLENAIEREIYAGKLSDEVGIQKDSVMQQVEKYASAKVAGERKKQFRQIQTEMSARTDQINPQKADNLRAARAEEALIAYVMNNPDNAPGVLQKLPPDKMMTDFNRRVYQIVTARIMQGKSAMLMDISEQFTPDENGAIAGMLSKYTADAATGQAAEEYINVILSEHDRISVKQSANADISDINDYLNKLRQKKQ